MVGLKLRRPEEIFAEFPRERCANGGLVKILCWRGADVRVPRMRLDHDFFKIGSPNISAKRHVTWRDLGEFRDDLNVFASDANAEILPTK